MKTSRKSFALFIFVIFIGVIVFCGKMIYSKSNELKTRDELESEWTGVIKLWDTSYIKHGTSSRTSWLNRYIRKFEKSNPGIYIDLRRIKDERVPIYFNSNLDRDVLPDIISINPNSNLVVEQLLLDLSIPLEAEYSRLHKQLQNECANNKIPWMCGGYVLAANKDMADSRELDIDSIDKKMSVEEMAKALTFEKKENREAVINYGFVTYTEDIGSPLLEFKNYCQLDLWANRGIAHPDIHNMNYSHALNMFAINKNAGMMFGDTRLLYSLRKLSNAGKGIEYMLIDTKASGCSYELFESYGALRCDNKEKLKVIYSFLSGLLSPEIQASLQDIGMFPVVTDVGTIYEEDLEMLQIYLHSN